MWRSLVLLAVVLVGVPVACGEDVVEFLSGAKVTGIVKSIRKADKEFDFAAKFGDQTVTRTYRFSKVHAVTMKGNRFVLTPMTTSGADGSATRTASEIDAVIEAAGAESPEWLASATTDHPPSLDLAWPLKAPGGWNARKNVGQFIWEIINPNPSRWHGGIKLIHQIAESHADDPELLKRDQNTLGKMYFELLQDYARAAYWFRQAGADMDDPHGVMLAECYWRLGNDAMAQRMLTARSFAAPTKVIKLHGLLGDTKRAIEIANRMQNTNVSNQAFLAAGDALRDAGQLDLAIKYYQRALEGKNYRNKEYKDRLMARARESIETIRLYDSLEFSEIPDGTYTGSSTGYNGRLTVEVKMSGGKLTSAKVKSHREKQFYSALTDTESKLIDRQTVQGIDGTSGATITAEAIVNATAKALAKQ